MHTPHSEDSDCSFQARTSPSALSLPFPTSSCFWSPSSPWHTAPAGLLPWVLHPKEQSTLGNWEQGKSAEEQRTGLPTTFRFVLKVYFIFIYVYVCVCCERVHECRCPRRLEAFSGQELELQESGCLTWLLQTQVNGIAPWVLVSAEPSLWRLILVLRLFSHTH